MNRPLPFFASCVTSVEAARASRAWTATASSTAKPIDSSGPLRRDPKEESVHRVELIRAEILAGTYETQARLDAAVERLLRRFQR